MRINHNRRRRSDLSFVDRFSELSFCNIIFLSFIGFTLGWLIAKVATYHLVNLYGRERELMKCDADSVFKVKEEIKNADILILDHDEAVLYISDGFGCNNIEEMYHNEVYDTSEAHLYAIKVILRHVPKVMLIKINHEKALFMGPDNIYDIIKELKEVEGKEVCVFTAAVSAFADLKNKAFQKDTDIDIDFKTRVWTRQHLESGKKNSLSLLRGLPDEAKYKKVVVLDDKHTAWRAVGAKEPGDVDVGGILGAHRSTWEWRCGIPPRTGTHHPGLLLFELEPYDEKAYFATIESISFDRESDPDKPPIKITFKD